MADCVISGEEFTSKDLAKIAVSTLEGALTAVVVPTTGAIISGVAGGINSALSVNPLLLPVPNLY